MTHTICFKNIEPIHHLKDFIESHVEQSVEKFCPDNHLIAKVVIEKKKFKTQSELHPDFCCEIKLYHPGLKRTLIAMKTSSNFYASVRNSCKAIEKVLRRFAKTKSKRRHKNFEIANSFT